MTQIIRAWIGRIIQPSVRNWPKIVSYQGFAGVQPAAAQCFGSFLRSFVIAQHHIGIFDHNFSLLACRTFVVIQIKIKRTEFLLDS